MEAKWLAVKGYPGGTRAVFIISNSADSVCNIVVQRMSGQYHPMHCSSTAEAPVCACLSLSLPVRRTQPGDAGRCRAQAGGVHRESPGCVLGWLSTALAQRVLSILLQAHLWDLLGFSDCTRSSKNWVPRPVRVDCAAC